MTDSIQLLGISNAIVDVLAHVDHDFLGRIGAEPGSMTLIDKDRAKEVYNMMGPATEMSGGSVANTVAGFANLGGSGAYIGKVRDDQLGRIFNHMTRQVKGQRDALVEANLAPLDYLGKRFVVQGLAAGAVKG